MVYTRCRDTRQKGHKDKRKEEQEAMVSQDRPHQGRKGKDYEIKHKTIKEKYFVQGKRKADR